jgi:hypothetical protein
VVRVGLHGLVVVTAFCGALQSRALLLQLQLLLWHWCCGNSCCGNCCCGSSMLLLLGIQLWRLLRLSYTGSQSIRFIQRRLQQSVPVFDC